ncbi:hypothetical protein XPA_010755 [Xanthoria parietina]
MSLGKLLYFIGIPSAARAFISPQKLVPRMPTVAAEGILNSKTTPPILNLHILFKITQFLAAAPLQEIPNVKMDSHISLPNTTSLIFSFPNPSSLPVLNSDHHLILHWPHQFLPQKINSAIASPKRLQLQKKCSR